MFHHDDLNCTSLHVVSLDTGRSWTAHHEEGMQDRSPAWSADGAMLAFACEEPPYFNMDSMGRLMRRDERRIAPFIYAGAAILHPRLFADCPDGPFSLNLLFDRALEAGRLFGLRLDGLWLHVGTPDAIQEAEEAIARSAA